VFLKNIKTGGKTMNLTYDEGVGLIKQCWLDNGHVINFGKMAAINSLRRHLEQNNLSYSHDEALNWLNLNRESWDNQTFFRMRRAVYEFNEVMTLGKITGNYKYYETSFDRLPECWQTILIEYKEDLLTRLKPRATRDQIIHCTSFATFLVNNDIYDPEEITVPVISKYHEYAESIGDKYICIYSVRYFLQFLANQGFIPKHRSYSLTAPVQAKAAGFALKNISVATISEINAKESELRLSAETFLERCQELIKSLEETYRFDPAALRSNYLAYFQMFYVFASELNLDYTPAVAAYWLKSMDAFSSDFRVGPMKYRCFHVLETFIECGQTFIPKIPPVTAPTGMEVSLLVWSRGLLEEYLSAREKEGLSANTISHHKSAGISFLLYLQSQGLTSISEVTPQLIKVYNISTAQKSSNKKNNYAYSIRQFLQYLFEKKYTEQNLVRSLPSQYGKSRKIVDILSDDEIQRIYTYRNNAHTPLELRDSAILMIGLLMGLRGIDVINLRFSNIDWKHQTIAITQQKTYRPLILPMPVPVGNSIFQYLKYGRPNSPSDHIFLSQRAPYGNADRSACNTAMERVFNGEKHSFHILRRTFATRLLSAGIGTDTIKDSLGHSTIDTVNRYLSVDEEGIRSCCLPIKRTVK
jgi:site-specific recombinase XerD